MAELKRYGVKYIRDRVKSKYPVKIRCDICSSAENLEFHHFNSLAELWNKWGRSVETAEEMMIVRDEFIQQYWKELVELGATLCSKHHEMLHKIYGKNPPLHTAEKQARWVEKQRIKHES